MKFLMAIAFLTVVCAIPRPGQNSTSNEEFKQLVLTKGSGQENNQVENAKGASHCVLLLSELEKSDESEYIDDDDDEDEDDSNEKVSLDDLINALHIIRNAIQKKIHNNQSHYKDSEDDINVRSKRAPAYENETVTDAPQQYNRTSEEPGNNGNHQQNSSAVSNNTNGNDTASDYKPKINITQIIKDIHDNIGSIIANILQSSLGNSSLPEDRNKIQNNLTHKDSEDNINVRSKRASEKSGNETTTDAPQQSNRTSEEPGIDSNHPRNNSVISNNSKGNNSASDHKPKINITQIIKDIHDKIDNIMANILQSRLGNSSLSEEDRKTIHNNLIHKDSEDDIYVPSERVPVHEDSANETAADTPQGNRTIEGPGNNSNLTQNNSAVSNNTKGNDTSSDQKPKMNITQIKKEIHDKVDSISSNIIANILQSRLGNRSLPKEDGNTNNTATNAPQQKNGTEFKQDGGIGNGTAIDNNSQNANNTDLPPNDIASNETESDDFSNDLVKVNSSPNIDKVIDNEISNIVPIEHSQLSESPRNFQANDESTSEVRVVNPIRWYTRKAMQQSSLSYRNFPHLIAHNH